MAKIEFDCPYGKCAWPECATTPVGVIEHPSCAAEIEAVKRSMKLEFRPKGVKGDSKSWVRR